MHEDTVHLVYQRRLKDEHKDPDVLPKVNKASMTEIIEVIK